MTRIGSKGGSATGLLTGADTAYEPSRPSWVAESVPSHLKQRGRSIVYRRAQVAPGCVLADTVHIDGPDGGARGYSDSVGRAAGGSASGRQAREPN